MTLRPMANPTAISAPPAETLNRAMFLPAYFKCAALIHLGARDQTCSFVAATILSKVPDRPRWAAGVPAEAYFQPGLLAGRHVEAELKPAVGNVVGVQLLRAPVR